MKAILLIIQIFLHEVCVSLMFLRDQEMNLAGTVDENIIAAIKMRNNFGYPLKLVIFAIAILDFSVLLPI